MHELLTGAANALKPIAGSFAARQVHQDVEYLPYCPNDWRVRTVTSGN